VLVFRPLIALLRADGHEVEITTRDYGQTLELLELHGLDATVLGRHGGRARRGKARALRRARWAHACARSRGGRARAGSTSRSRTGRTS
jgi:predicted glycosyltransferase